MNEASPALPRWIVSSCRFAFVAALLWTVGLLGYDSLTARGRMLMELSRTGGGESLPWPALLHALTALTACGAARRDMRKVPGGWLSAAAAAIYIGATVACLSGLSVSLRAHFSDVDDEFTPAWSRRIATLQLLWLAYGGWFTWRLCGDRARSPADRSRA